MPAGGKGTSNKTYKAIDLFSCVFCKFKTKYKHCLNVHNLAHGSKGTVSCKKCDIVFPSHQSLLIWHSKNELQKHVSYLSKMRKMKIAKGKKPFRLNQESSCQESMFDNFQSSQTTEGNSLNGSNFEEASNEESNSALDVKVSLMSSTKNVSQKKTANVDNVETETYLPVDGHPNEPNLQQGNADFNNNEINTNSRKYDLDDETVSENIFRKNSQNADDSENLQLTDSPKSVELLTCLICQTSFITKGLLMKHLLKIHHLTNICQVCYFRDTVLVKFANAVSLRNHRVKFHEKEMKRCICGSLFIDDKTLYCHQKKFRCDETDQPKLQKCVCGKRFSSEKELDAHKVFKCRKRNLAGSDEDYVPKKDKNSNRVSRVKKTRSQQKDLLICCSPEEEKCYDKPPVSDSIGCHKKGRKKRLMTSIAIAGTICEPTVIKQETQVDENNNLMDNLFCEGNHEGEDGYFHQPASTVVLPKTVKELNHVDENNNLQGLTTNSLSKPKTIKLARRRLDFKAHKFNGCKLCIVRVSPCQIYSHQKIRHQRKNYTFSATGKNLS